MANKEKREKVRSSLVLPEKTYQELKQAAAEQDMKILEFLRYYIRLALFIEQANKESEKGVEVIIRDKESKEEKEVVLP